MLAVPISISYAKALLSLITHLLKVLLLLSIAQRNAFIPNSEVLIGAGCYFTACTIYYPDFSAARTDDILLLLNRTFEN